MTELNHTPVEYPFEKLRDDLMRLGMTDSTIAAAESAAQHLSDAGDMPIGDARAVTLTTIVAYKLNQDPEDLLDEEPEYHFVAAVRAVLPSPSAGFTAPEPLMSKDMYDAKMESFPTGSYGGPSVQSQIGDER